MNVVACAAPSGHLEPAPITSLPFAQNVKDSGLQAFWGTDDDYYLHTPSGVEGAEQWYRIDADMTEAPESTVEERVAISRLMADITPIGGGRVAFPIGSSGRRVYRVWRSGSAARSGRTRILAVRAARSRRQPA
jgi:hypothetical protein